MSGHARAPLPSRLVEGQLLLLRGAEVIRLDERATLVWQLLAVPASLDELTDRVVAATGASPGLVRADVETLLEQFTALGLLQSD